VQLSIDIACPLGAQQQTRCTPLLRSNDGTDGRTDYASRVNNDVWRCLRLTELTAAPAVGTARSSSAYLAEYTVADQVSSTDGYRWIPVTPLLLDVLHFNVYLTLTVLLSRCVPSTVCIVYADDVLAKLYSFYCDVSGLGAHLLLLLNKYINKISKIIYLFLNVPREHCLDLLLLLSP